MECPLELRQLRYFVTVGRQRHFGRAAALLGVAQPALSRQVAKLEAELKVQLLERHARGVSLTAEGEVLLARAEAVLSRGWRLAGGGACAAAGAPGHRVPRLLPERCRTLWGAPGRSEPARYPKVRLRITTAASPVLEAWIQEGRVDVAILNGPSDPSRFLLTPLLEEPVCLIGLRDDPRLATDRVELTTLNRLPLVVTGPPDGPMQRMLVAAQAQAQQALSPLAQVDTAVVGRQLVLAGVGPMVEVAAVVKAELEEGTLKAVPIGELRLQRFLARARGRAGSDAVARIAGLMRDCVAEMVAEGSWPRATALSGGHSTAEGGR